MRVIFYAIILGSYLLSYAQWSEQNSGVTTELLCVYAVSNSVVWACGVEGTIIRTTDSGVTWTDASGSGIPNTLTLNAISGGEEGDANTAFVTGTSSAAFVYKTTDGGTNWSQSFSVTGRYINSLVNNIETSGNFGLHCNPHNGYWQFYYTTNQGVNWGGLATFPQDSIETGWNNSGYSVYPIGWQGTNNERIYRSPQGYTWTAIATPGLTNSKAVWFKNSNEGMIGGEAILYSNNSGLDWVPVAAPGSGDVMGITARGDHWFYVRGSSVYQSTDNGANWSLVHTAPSGTFNHLVKARQGSNLWAVRSDGGISSSVSVVGFELFKDGIIAEKIKLFQNHPNPLNPTTVISWQLPVGSSVNITIYNLTGQKITTLVNEKQSAGSHSIEFDASHLPSGVYFYQLVTGEYIETRKMVVMK